MGLQQLDFDGNNKTEVAIKLLQVYENKDNPYYLAFSGGKDSTVIYDLAKKSGVAFDAHYCVSPIDPPQIHTFIKEKNPEVAWEYHARGWWKMVIKKGLPMRQARWCCQVIKEAGGKGRCVIVGIRREESTARKKQKCFEEARRGSKTLLSPILNWSKEEVWEYIRENTLSYCSLYDEGFNRLGCVLCPFSREVEKEILWFPQIVKLWKLACDHIVENRLASGKEYKHQFQTGQELFDWWVSRK